ncbi:MAG TPA: hypothetical protein PLE61_14990 [Vicinamibacterales bacterium]|nr:hypothetical protein [Vicinamibacterales bacterium]HPW22106.1 hypothetical protein [Vicinamibacterales bacterium]
MRLTLKAFAVLTAALLLALLGGWMWGSAGASRSREALANAGAGLHMANARARLLEARVDLFEVNFGRASLSLEDARAELTAAAQALDRQGRRQDADAIRAALAVAEEAQRLAGRLDQTANARAAEAIGLLPKAP